MEKDKTPVYSVDPNEVLRFQLHRLVTSLFKNYLVLVEELGDTHDDAVMKLKAALPKEYVPFVDLADYLTPERGAALRKKVLDSGNDVLRSVDELLKQFDIDFKR